MTATLNKPNVIPSLQFSSRLKLNDLQRDQLRRAFSEKALQANPDSIGTGGGIRVQTAHISDLEARLGMDKLTFSSLIASRESHAVPVLLRLQRELGVELVTEADLRESFESYLAHLQREYW